jgi:hypothetical protein
MQLEGAKAELAALRQADLGVLLRAIDGAEAAVRAVDSIATEMLRSTSSSGGAAGLAVRAG